MKRKVTNSATDYQLTEKKPPFHDTSSSQIHNLHGVPAIVAFHVKIQSHGVKIHRYPSDIKNIMTNLRVIYVTWSNSMQHNIHYSRRWTASRHFRFCDVIFSVCTESWNRSADHELKYLLKIAYLISLWRDKNKFNFSVIYLLSVFTLLKVEILT